jgi:hypothetical protein
MNIVAEIKTKTRKICVLLPPNKGVHVIQIFLATGSRDGRAGWNDMTNFYIFKRVRLPPNEGVHVA